MNQIKMHICIVAAMLTIMGCARHGRDDPSALAVPMGAHLSAQQVLAIAEPELAKRYPETFERNRPYRATFGNGMWHVYGTLPEACVGGTPEAHVRDSDGAIVRITHGR